MELRELLGRVGQKYDRKLGLKGDAQELLRKAPGYLQLKVSASYVTGASGGKGSAAIVPWIAVFDPDETTTAQRGMYVVYLYAADMNSISLSLIQGVTELTTRVGTKQGRILLQRQAAAIRKRFSPEQVEGLEASIDLRSPEKLPRDYEAGNIVAKTYPVGALPSEEELVADLHRFMLLYEQALELRTELRLSEVDIVHTTIPRPQVEIMAEFKPKSDADYEQLIKGGIRRVTRKHERLVREYGQFLRGKEFMVNTKVHPRDLTAVRGDAHWLIEAKMVRGGNGVQATREAIGQLLMYRHVIYKDLLTVQLLALFSESVGNMCVGFLENHGIASIWSSEGGWAGSPSAATADLSSL